MHIRTGTTYLLAALLTGGIGCGSSSNNNGTGGSGGHAGSGGTHVTGGNGGNRAGGGNGGTATGVGGNGGNATGGAGAGGNGGAAATLTDPQVAGVVLTANLGEVQEAQLAQSKSTNTAVLNFANMMITDHNAATTRLQQILDQQNIMTADSSQRQSLSSMANTTYNTLFTQTGATFDKSYAMSQVMAHQTVLNLFDQVLIPSAQNAALKAELQTERTAVANHLTMAQQLFSALSSDAGVSDAGGDAAH